MTASDDRIPLRFGSPDEAGPKDALLLDDTLAHRFVANHAPASAMARFRSGAAHGIGCFCCAGRSAAATALGGLFQDRATGRVAWFTRVVAAVADPEALENDLRSDRVLASRFRLEGSAGGQPNQAWSYTCK